MVPEDENTPEQNPDAEDQKVAVDDQEVSESEAKSNKKVELDLDDAPFLEWDDDEEGEEEGGAGEKKEVAESGEKEEAEEKEAKEPLLVRLKRRWRLLAAAAALLVVSAVVSIWFFAFQEEPGQVPRVTDKTQPSESAKNESEQSEQVSLQPFWVEYDAGEDYQHFHLGIDLNVNGSKPAWELQKKMPVIRDSLYYFLKNKDIGELSDKNSIKDLKKEILTIVNNNLSNGKADQVLIQKYLVE